MNCHNLKQIIIPSSITSIGDNSFDGCINLEEVIIPSSVASIGKYCFNNCTKLKEIIIPFSVTSIGDFFISNCISLKEIIIPSNVQNIGIFEFKNFALLKEFIIPSSVTMIHDRAFYKCSSLTNIVIPLSVTAIGQWAFYKCSSLQEISIPSSVISIGKCAFCDCLSLKEVTFSSLVDSIERHVFYGCSSLKHITLPPSVKTIGDHAFCGCASLNEIAIPSSISSIGFNAFKGCTCLKIPIPSTINDREKYVKFIRESLLKQDIPPIVKQIDNYIVIDHSYKCTINNNQNNVLKIAIVGYSNVGKTCITKRYIYNNFDYNTSASIGIGYHEKNAIVDENEIKVQIWDTIESNRIHFILRFFHGNINGIAYIFDFVDKKSFEYIKNYIDEVNHEVGSIPSVLIGNKCDCMRYDMCEKIEEYAKDNNIKYFEVSALNNINIKESFAYITTEAFHLDLYKNRSNIISSTNINVDISITDQKRNKPHC